MRYRVLLVITVLIILSSHAVNVSAQVNVTSVTVTTDRSTYVNESVATATAVLEFTGPKSKLDNVSFTWYRPDLSVAGVELDSAVSDGNATSSLVVDMVGIWFVNATYVDQPEQFNVTSFEVLSADDFVIVTDMTMGLNAPYFELAEVVVATVALTYMGNVSILEPVNFTWIDPLGAIIRPVTSILPDSTGVAVDSWQCDIEGDFFLVYANYTGDDPISKSVSFQVFPTRVKTWHNFSVVVNEVWDLAGEPYGVCDNITIEAGSTLTIEAGVTVRFCEDTHMTVNGTLISDGTLDSFVNLTAYGFFKSKGYWKGITVNPSSGNTSSITHTLLSSASIGLLISSASPTIERSVFDNMSFAAIRFDNTNANAEFNSFLDVDRGIYASASNISLRFNMFSNVVMGLALIDSDVALHGDSIFNSSSFGIQAINSSISASDINISVSGGSALRLQSESHADMESSVIEDTWYGLDAFSSTFLVSESSLRTNDNALRANDAQGDVINTSIADSADFDFILEGGSTVIVLNSTFNDSRVNVLPASHLIVKQFLDVYVEHEDSGDPISNALVEVLDGGTFVLSSRTPSSGRIRWIQVTDRSFDGVSTATKHQITVRISKDGYEIAEAERTIDMSTSRLEVFVGTEVIQDIWGQVSDPFFLLALLVIIAILLAALIVARRRLRGEEDKIPKKKVRKPADYVLNGGASYLVAGEKPDLAFGMFSNAIAGGARGLCVTRALPDDISQKYELGDTPILWLSRDSKRANISPTNLGAIILEVQKFIRKEAGKESIVMLDGLEYLIVQNDFSKVFKFVQNLKDTISVGGSKLVIPFNLAALEESRQALLTRDLELLE